MTVQLLEHNFSEEIPASCERIAYLRLLQTDHAGPEPTTAEIPVLLLEAGRHTLFQGPATQSLTAGRERIVRFRWRSPGRTGQSRLELKLINGRKSEVTLLRTQLNITEPMTSRSIRLMESAYLRNPWFYLPSEGIHWSSSGAHYPLFVQEAKGARFHDAEARAYLDYTCGWGACFLGHAEPRIAQAVADSLGRRALSGLPQDIEIELTERLCALFPGAEMALFGKNGSDVTTAAVRMARHFSGRPLILYGGYHGWHDWNRPDETQAVPFAPGNIQDLTEFFARYRGQVAAVILEPAAWVGGVEGPVPDADPDFLHGVCKLCRREGALLIFDEIFTGFRYRKGSVQRAFDIRPDLTCLGKALGAGFPISALLGSRRIFSAVMNKIRYHPTYKGEPHAFAAALQAIRIHETERPYLAVWNFGSKLMEGIDALCRRHNIAARMEGLPIRMVLRFAPTPDDAALGPLRRTFLQQQLLQRGLVSFRGFLMPTAAHSQEDLTDTLCIFDESLKALREAELAHTLVKQLELPLIL
jgi:glutamate-1-semialdehyde 2,1-aminomutase